MTNKLYDIYLDGEKIGHTALEKADAPMGVVFGEIIFTDIVSGYSAVVGVVTNNKKGLKRIKCKSDTGLYRLR